MTHIIVNIMYPISSCTRWFTKIYLKFLSNLFERNIIPLLLSNISSSWRNNIWIPDSIHVISHVPLIQKIDPSTRDFPSREKLSLMEERCRNSSDRIQVFRFGARHALVVVVVGTCYVRANSLLCDKLWHALPGCTIVHLVASVLGHVVVNLEFFPALSAREMRRKRCNVCSQRKQWERDAWEKRHRRRQQNLIYIDIDFLSTPFDSILQRKKKKNTKISILSIELLINTKLKCDEDTDCDRSIDCN